MKILVTGGSGYIGSHTAVSLLQAGHQVVVLDNLVNSAAESLIRVEKICDKSVLFIEGDIRDRNLLDQLFTEQKIDTVMHFAGVKAVAESVIDPLKYYETNFVGSLTLLQAMAEAEVRRLVFSSSATVYGEPDEVPIKETSARLRPTNPYGHSKLMVEQLLRDYAVADPSWSIAIMRYFNPVGAHKSGMLGESAAGTPNNLLPTITRVAEGSLKKLSIFGNDYMTPDGTCVRDYIHVMDLALGHLRALEFISDKAGINTWNLGTGRGYSVLEVVSAFEAASGKMIPIDFVARRDGDIAESCADISKAAKELNWQAEFDINAMMQDLWRWQSNNPDGYRASDE